MKIVVQRSLNSKVSVDNKVVGSINKGLVLLVGFKKDDTIEEVKYMVNKVLNLRIFNDSEGKQNKSVLDVEGEILSISQFTLYGDTKKSGNRPSYSNAMNGIEAQKLYEIFNKELSKYIKIETGVFGANMDVTINNDGPVTIILER